MDAVGYGKTGDLVFTDTAEIISLTVVVKLEAEILGTEKWLLFDHYSKYVLCIRGEKPVFSLIRGSEAPVMKFDTPKEAVRFSVTHGMVCIPSLDHANPTTVVTLEEVLALKGRL